MAHEKPRLVIDLPSSIRRKIHQIQQKANDTIVVFSDALEIFECLESPSLFDEIAEDPELLKEIAAAMEQVLARWQGVLGSLEHLATGARHWGLDPEAAAPTGHPDSSASNLPFPSKDNASLP